MWSNDMMTAQEAVAEVSLLGKVKKYMINVDFPTESLIHLNPLVYEIDTRCQPGEKELDDGGIVYATEDEVEEYMAEPRGLIYNGREVTNLRTCKLCARLPDYDLS